RGGVTLGSVDRAGSVAPVSTTVTVAESGLRSGSLVALVSNGASPSTDAVAPAAVLQVHSGPDAGRSFDLRPGVNLVGRGRHAAVRLNDPLVSTLHARIVVG